MESWQRYPAKPSDTSANKKGFAKISDPSKPTVGRKLPYNPFLSVFIWYYLQARQTEDITRSNGVYIDINLARGATSNYNNSNTEEA